MGIEGEAALQAALLRRAARKRLLPWCEYVLGGDRRAPARHHRLLISHLEGVSVGTCDRLIVNMPPGSAKSTYTSVLFPPWYMMRHPKHQIIHGSASLNLVTDFSGKIQNLIREHSAVHELELASENKELWYTTSGCRYRAAGVDTNVAGNRADLAIIDDPFGGWEEAESPTQRNRVYNWFREDIINRMLPGGRIVVVQTRWHEDDLTGRLLADGADNWTVLKLPQIAAEDDPLGREPGEVLWPEFEDLKAVERKRRNAGPRAWAAQHQQNPKPTGGALFNVGKVRVIPGIASGRRIRAWDIAATEAIGTRDPDYTVGALLNMPTDNAFAPEGSLVIEDIVRARGGPSMVEKLIMETAARDGKSVSIFLPQDPAQSGKWQAQYLVRKLAGYTVIVERPSGNKSTRAMPVASQMEVGNVAIVKAAWNRDFIDEFEVFPGGSHDDQIDAVSGGYAVMLNRASGGAFSIQKLGY